MLTKKKNLFLFLHFRLTLPVLVGGILNWRAVVRLLNAANRVRAQIAPQAKFLKPLHPARAKTTFVDLNTSTLTLIAKRMSLGESTYCRLSLRSLCCLCSSLSVPLSHLFSCTCHPITVLVYPLLSQTFSLRLRAWPSPAARGRARTLQLSVLMRRRCARECEHTWPALVKTAQQANTRRNACRLRRVSGRMYW